ncbi:MAG: 2Fe-2S iron-sulfur cluster-binding family protein [Rhodospirillaceae bacterium]
MVTVIFISPDGAAARGGVSGIVGECGGNAICCTRHVYVEQSWLARLPPMDEDKDALLEGTAAARTQASRLSYQIKVTAELDGLIVTVPPRRY